MKIKKQNQSILKVRILKAAIFGACLSTSTLALAQSTTPPLSDAPKEVAAQIGVTHDAIAAILQKIGSGKGTQGFNAHDYLSSLETFKTPIEKATETFENRLRDEILPQVSKLADFYNSIYNSEGFTQEQKSQLMRQQWPGIIDKMKTISVEYQKDLADLYGAIRLPLDPSWVSPTVDKVFTNTDKRNKANRELEVERFKSTCPGIFDGEEEHKHKHDNYWVYDYYDFQVTDPTTGQTATYPTCTTHADNGYFYDVPSLKIQHAFYKNSDEFFFSQFLYPVVSTACRSQLCIGLRAVDLKTFIQMVHDTLDVELKFTLADKEVFALEPLHKQVDAVLSNLAITTYPGKPLPFQE